MKQPLRKGEPFLLAIIVLVAIFFRTYRLDAIPRGMSGDEAIRGLEALSIARGEGYPVFLVGSFGEEPIHGYLVAVLFRLLGPSVFAIRAASALVGVLTVPVFYFMVRALFPPSEGSQPWLAILATGWLATSYWHTVYSRWGSEPIVAPLFAVLTMYCFWRAFDSGRRLHYLLGGASLGLSLYTYQAARFLPILALVLVGYHVYINRGSLRSHWVSLLSLLLAFLIVVAPLASYALNHPEIYLARAKAVSIFSPDRTVSPWTSLLLGLVQTAGMYNFHGDEHPEHSPSSGRPVLDPLTSVCFALGLAVTIYRFREPRYFLLAMWLLVMSLPAVVAGGSSASFSRTVVALPAVYVFPAIGVLEAWKWLSAKVKSARVSLIMGCSLALAPLLFATATTYQDYFVAWDTREDLRWGYDGAYTEAATVMNQTQVPDSVWILPVTAYVPSGYGADHFDFLYHGDVPYYSLSLDEATAPDELSEASRSRRRALVLDWKGYDLEKAYTAMSADPKRLLPFLLEKYGRELSRKSYEAFDLATYELPESSAFLIADRLEPAAVSFGDELMLTGMNFGGSSLADTSTPQEVDRRSLPAGKSAWVVLRWRATRAPSRDYKVAVYLEDEGGHIAGQVNKLLLSNYLHRTGEWQDGQEEIDYYTLQSWSGTPPGWYKVGVTVYDAASADVLYAGGKGRSYDLGMIEVVRPLAPGPVEPGAEIQNAQGEVAGRIQLLGYDLPRRELNPGDELSVALYWQALKDVDRAYLLAVQLANEQGETWTEEPDAPVYGSYPTLEWTKGETLKDWHDMSLPAEMPQGSYQVSVLIAERGSLLQEVNL